MIGNFVVYRSLHLLASSNRDFPLLAFGQWSHPPSTFRVLARRSVSSSREFLILPATPIVLLQFTHVHLMPPISPIARCRVTHSYCWDWKFAFLSWSLNEISAWKSFTLSPATNFFNSHSILESLSVRSKSALCLAKIASYHDMQLVNISDRSQPNHDQVSNCRTSPSCLHRTSDSISLL